MKVTQTKKLLLIGVGLYGLSFVFDEATLVSDVLRVVGFITLLVTLITFLREWSTRKRSRDPNLFR